MSEDIQWGFDLSANQKAKFARAAKKGEGVSIKLAPNQLKGPTKIAINPRQAKKIQKRIKEGKGIILEITETQMRRIIRGGFIEGIPETIWPILGTLGGDAAKEIGKLALVEMMKPVGNKIGTTLTEKFSGLFGSEKKKKKKKKDKKPPKVAKKVAPEENDEEEVIEVPKKKERKVVGTDVDGYPVYGDGLSRPGSGLSIPGRRGGAIKKNSKMGLIPMSMAI